MELLLIIIVSKILKRRVFFPLVYNIASKLKVADGFADGEISIKL